MKKTVLNLLWVLLLAAVCPWGSLNAKEVVVKNADVVAQSGKWTIIYYEKNKSFYVTCRMAGKEKQDVLSDFTPEATYDIAGGDSRTVNASSFGRVTYEKKKIKDAFGKGVCFSFLFSAPDNGDKVALRQNFYVYGGHEYMLADASVEGDASLRSNYIAPVKVAAGFAPFEADADNRMLKVPFDNDGFVRYHYAPLDREQTSYEVSALFSGKTRRGIVLGSVEHNHWKSAVKMKAHGNKVFDTLTLFSGVADNETRDVLPHGKLCGPVVRSARMFIGCYADWREGMEAFATANTLVQPMRDTWKRGTPFGWQSWGVMADKNSFEVDTDVADYFQSTLKPAGFCNDQGVNIISIDAWDNLSHEQKIELCKRCEANGQIAGTYQTPFSLWWNEDMLKTRKLEGQDEYTGWDCVLKVNGQPYKYDGAYCLDPTHPGTKARIRYDVGRLKAEGFKYVKVDFTDNGIIEADSYYNPAVKTGVEAYNEGFSYFLQEADKGEPLFIALSIAPVFPYQYGNSRRIACDTWGKINQSEYSLNAVGGGWWTNNFYQYNDPDHMVLVGNDEVKETEGENRARVTNGAISGMLLVSDNYSLNDKSGRGDARLSRERAGKVLMNRDVNELGNLGRAFRPVYGYKPFNGNAWDAENCFLRHTDEYLYVAVVNFKEEALDGSLPFEALDIKAGAFDEVKELWTGETVSVPGDRLDYSVPAKDARIYRFHKK